MVEWPRTVNPVLKKRNRFESYHLHQIWLHSIMVSTVACHAINRSSILLGAAKLVCTVRLSVRTLAFHVSKTGSIPVPCTKYIPQ